MRPKRPGASSPSSESRPDGGPGLLVDTVEEAEPSGVEDDEPGLAGVVDARARGILQRRSCCQCRVVLDRERPLNGAAFTRLHRGRQGPCPFRVQDHRPLSPDQHVDVLARSRSSAGRAGLGQRSCRESRTRCPGLGVRRRRRRRRSARSDRRGRCAALNSASVAPCWPRGLGLTE